MEESNLSKINEILGKNALLHRRLTMRKYVVVGENFPEKNPHLNSLYTIKVVIREDRFCLDRI